MSLPQWIDKAGDFDITHVGGIPHFSQEITLSAPPAGVLHTTEGNWVGSLAVFKQHYAPHFLLGLNNATGKVEIAQLVPIGFIGAALVTHNWLARVQIEMVGYSKETLWLPDQDTLHALASLMAVLERDVGIPLIHPWPDGVYGKATATDPHRNAGQFGKVAGWFGHGDVPSPDSHWDPGAIQWSEILKAAKAIEVGAAPAPVPAFARPCASAALDADLIYAVEHSDAATKAAIVKALAA